MRRCISSTGSLYSYSYSSQDGTTAGSTSNDTGACSSSINSSTSSTSSNHLSSGGNSPIPIYRPGTPIGRPGRGVASASLSTSPGSFYHVITPPMNSPRGPSLAALPPFERTWDDDVVRVVCISDTHSRHDALLREPGLLPPGDILVHAGDFTTTGTKPQMENFRDFLKTVPYAHKVVVGGNHDITLHEEYYEETGEERFHKNRPDGPYFAAQMRRMFLNLRTEANVHYLENEAVELMGVMFWATPWTPEYGGWAFNYEPEGDFCRELYSTIPAHTDVLITHGPPAGVGDLTIKGVRAGCPVLLEEVRSRIRPRVHVFGHIHEGFGAYQDETGQRYLNASTSTIQYRPINPPVVFDVPLDKSQPIRWVSLTSEDVTRLDLSTSPPCSLPAFSCSLPPSPSILRPFLKSGSGITEKAQEGGGEGGGEEDEDEDEEEGREGREEEREGGLASSLLEVELELEMVKRLAFVSVGKHEGRADRRKEGTGCEEQESSKGTESEAEMLRRMTT